MCVHVHVCYISYDEVVDTSVVESSTILSRSSPVSVLVSTFGAFKDMYGLSCHR